MQKPTVELSGLGTDFDRVSAKVGTVLRHVDISDINTMVHNAKPSVGDVVLAKVMSVGDKSTLQNPQGRDVELLQGDKILVAYGNRYAVEEYRALIPEDLGECHLVSGGGVASRIQEQNEAMGKPTVIKPLGLFGGKDGMPLNTRDYAMIPHGYDMRARPPVILIMGTGMDAGKTTLASSLIKGMTRAGYKAGFGKITGTGLSSDIYKPFDAGAIAGCDFVDMGYPSTYRIGTDEIEEIMTGVTKNLSLHGSEVIIVEVADGVLQADNRKLLQSPTFQEKVDGVVLAADSGLSALFAVEKLNEYGYEPLAVGGRMTMAPLTVKEFERGLRKDMHVEMGVLTRDQMQQKGTANKMLDTMLARRQGEPNRIIREIMERRGFTVANDTGVDPQTLES